MIYFLWNNFINQKNFKKIVGDVKFKKIKELLKIMMLLFTLRVFLMTQALISIRTCRSIAMILLKN